MCPGVSSTPRLVGAASAVMALAVCLIPSVGGVIELLTKAAVGGLIYGGCALAFDLGDLRRRGLQLARVLQAKIA